MNPLKLSIVQEQPGARLALPVDVEARLEALRAALLRESELVIQLRDELLRQRAAVAHSQTAAVEGTSEATSRLMLALDEARRRRGEIVAAMTGDAEVPIDHLEAQLGHALPPDLESARLTLKRAAAEAAREAAINRVVLKRAVEAGETFLQDLFSGGASTPPTYGSTPSAPPAPPSGRLLDRKA